MVQKLHRKLVFSLSIYVFLFSSINNSFAQQTPTTTEEQRRIINSEESFDTKHTQIENSAAKQEVENNYGPNIDKSNDVLEGYDNFSLKELLNVQVTSASKIAEGANEAPSSVTVFTRSDINRLGVTTVEQLLNFVPGFQGTTDMGNGLFRFSARGRNTLTHEYVLVLVDDLRLNDVYTGGAPNPITVENIEQIEIIRGPGSSLYGANAFLGVINIKTVRDVSNASVGFGDRNMRYAAINYNKKFDTLDFSAFARIYSDDGFRFRKIDDVMGQTNEAYDPTFQADISFALNYKKFNLSANHLKRIFEGLSCCTSYSRYSDRANSAQSTIRLTYEDKLSEDIDFNAAIHFSRDERLNITTEYPVGSIPDPRSGVQLEQTYLFGKHWQGKSLGANLDFTWRLYNTDWIDGILIFGLSYSLASIDKLADVSTHDEYWNYLGDIYEFRKPEIERKIAAGYLQTKIFIWSQLQFTAGVRYDNYSDFGNSINPRAAIVYSTPLKSHLKIMYGQAFRAPSFAEMHDNPQRTSTSSTAELKAETVKTIEVAYVQQLADYAQGSVTYFHNQIENIIQPPQSILPYRNFGESTMKGLEFEIRSRELFGASLTGSYTRLLPNKEEEEKLIVPFSFGAAAINYTYSRLNISINSIFRDKSKIGGNIYGNFVTYKQPAYALYNAHIKIAVLPALQVYGLVNNIFDYQQQRSRQNQLPAGLLNRGRTFMLGMKVEL